MDDSNERNDGSDSNEPPRSNTRKLLIGAGVAGVLVVIIVVVVLLSLGVFSPGSSSASVNSKAVRVLPAAEPTADPISSTLYVGQRLLLVPATAPPAQATVTWQYRTSLHPNYVVCSPTFLVPPSITTLQFRYRINSAADGLESSLFTVTPASATLGSFSGYFHTLRNAYRATLTVGADATSATVLACPLRFIHHNTTYDVPDADFDIETTADPRVFRVKWLVSAAVIDLCKLDYSSGHLVVGWPGPNNTRIWLGCANAVRPRSSFSLSALTVPSTLLAASPASGITLSTSEPWTSLAPLLSWSVVIQSTPPSVVNVTPVLTGTASGSFVNLTWSGDSLPPYVFAATRYKLQIALGDMIVSSGPFGLTTTALYTIIPSGAWNPSAAPFTLIFQAPAGTANPGPPTVWTYKLSTDGAEADPRPLTVAANKPTTASASSPWSYTWTPPIIPAAVTWITLTATSTAAGSTTGSARWTIPELPTGTLAWTAASASVPAFSQLTLTLSSARLWSSTDPAITWKWFSAEGQQIGQQNRQTMYNIAAGDPGSTPSVNQVPPTTLTLTGASPTVMSTTATFSASPPLTAAASYRLELVTTGPTITPCSLAFTVGGSTPSPPGITVVSKAWNAAFTELTLTLSGPPANGWDARSPVATFVWTSSPSSPVLTFKSYTSSVVKYTCSAITTNGLYNLAFSTGPGGPVAPFSDFKFIVGPSPAITISSMFWNVNFTELTVNFSPARPWSFDNPALTWTWSKEGVAYSPDWSLLLGASSDPVSQIKFFIFFSPFSSLTAIPAGTYGLTVSSATRDVLTTSFSMSNFTVLPAVAAPTPTPTPTPTPPPPPPPQTGFAITSIDFPTTTPTITSYNQQLQFRVYTTPSNTVGSTTDITFTFHMMNGPTAELLATWVVLDDVSSPEFDTSWSSAFGYLTITSINKLLSLATQGIPAGAQLRITVAGGVAGTTSAAYTPASINATVQLVNGVTSFTVITDALPTYLKFNVRWTNGADPPGNLRWQVGDPVPMSFRAFEWASLGKGSGTTRTVGNLSAEYTWSTTGITTADEKALPVGTWTFIAGDANTFQTVKTSYGLVLLPDADANRDTYLSAHGFDNTTMRNAAGGALTNTTVYPVQRPEEFDTLTKSGTCFATVPTTRWADYLRVAVHSFVRNTRLASCALPASVNAIRLAVTDNPWPSGRRMCTDVILTNIQATLIVKYTDPVSSSEKGEIRFTEVATDRSGLVIHWTPLARGAIWDPGALFKPTGECQIKITATAQVIIQQSGTTAESAMSWTSDTLRVAPITTLAQLAASVVSADAADSTPTAPWGGFREPNAAGNGYIPKGSIGTTWKTSGMKAVTSANAWTDMRISSGQTSFIYTAIQTPTADGSTGFMWIPTGVNQGHILTRNDNGLCIKPGFVEPMGMINQSIPIGTPYVYGCWWDNAASDATDGCSSKVVFTAGAENWTTLSGTANFRLPHVFSLALNSTSSTPLSGVAAGTSPLANAWSNFATVFMSNDSLGTTTLTSPAALSHPHNIIILATDASATTPGISWWRHVEFGSQSRMSVDASNDVTTPTDNNVSNKWFNRQGSSVDLRRGYVRLPLANMMTF